MTKSLAVAAVVLVTMASAASAVDIESLRSQVQAQLGSKMELRGIDNCYNKCQILLNQTQYLINVIGSDTYEYRACAVGCSMCETELNKKKSDKAACFTQCKNMDWAAQAPPIEKGIIEPDKACIFGCVINTCQAVCQGGSLGKDTAAGRWPSTGGCRIVTSYEAQSSKYQWHNTGDQSGASNCCSNAMSLCRYTGNKNSHNYKTTVDVTKRSCQGAVSPLTPEAICAAFNDNCGSQV